MAFGFINNLIDYFSTNIAIDLGTANIPIYIKGKGVKICEPSYIAIDRKLKKILAVGHGAKNMEGRVPKHIEVIRPITEGIISDFEAAAEMINHLIERLQMGSNIIGAKVIIGIPSKATPLDEKTVTEAVSHSGTRKVYTLNQPLAGAIGLGLPIMEPKGNMIVDIGGGTTQVAVISMGDRVVNENIDLAGDKLTEKILTYMRLKYSLAVGYNTAEEIKMFLGSACPHPDEMTMKVKGSDVITGLPKTVKVKSGEIRESLGDLLKEIMDTIKICLEKTPPELMNDIHEKGIMLTGGGALLKGMDKLIEKTTGLTVKLAKTPIYTVALGLGELFKNHDLFKQLIKEKRQVKYQV